MKLPVDPSVQNKINQGYVSLSAAEPLQWANGHRAASGFVFMEPKLDEHHRNVEIKGMLLFGK